MRCELQDELQLLQLKYNLSALLEQKSNEATGGNPKDIYEKYFNLRQGELAGIEKVEDASECGKFGYLNSHFGGITFEIDNGMYVQYSNDLSISEYLLPTGLIVMNPDIELGFMEARAGMNFEEIQENACEGEIQKGFMYTEESYVYYMEFADDFYKYIYVSEYEDGSDSWLTIHHNTW